MKQEETNDIATILIEATDERSTVINQISKQTKPVIIVLPVRADQIFRQPGDFFELKRLKRERGLSITLVISGHERIRNMARRQGFQVYTSAETCVRAMARRDRLYTMRGISHSGITGNLDQTRLTAQHDEGDEDTPWSYDVQMHQAASTVATPKQTRELSTSDAPPWSYDVQMNHTPSLQSGDESDGDTPWSYDVQMNHNATPTQQQHPRRTAWMLAEEELWNQTHRQPTQRDQHTHPSYMAGVPLAGALPGTHNPSPFNASTQPGASASQWNAPASLSETPVPPSFTETLENLIALSGEKQNAPHSNVHNSGTLNADARTRATRHIEQIDEIPTQPGNAHPYMASGDGAPINRASLAGTLQTRTHRTGAPETEPLYPTFETQPLTDNEHPGSRIALMLTALLVLGILGGVCCGYILTIMHVNLTVLTSWNPIAGTDLSCPWGVISSI